MNSIDLEPRHDHGEHVEGECHFYHALVFHTGVCQEILFPGWKSVDGLTVFGSAVALFVAGFLYEGLKAYRETIAMGYSTNSERKNEKRDGPPGPNNVESGPKAQYSMTSSTHIIQTLLHLIQTTCSYILMLIFMTYNVWLCMGLILGLGLGYFVFGWRYSSVSNTHECCC